MPLCIPLELHTYVAVNLLQRSIVCWEKKCPWASPIWC